jgi:hypothetical protein
VLRCGTSPHPEHSSEGKTSYNGCRCDSHRLLVCSADMTDARRALVRKLENVDAFPLIALQAIHEMRADLDEVEAEALLRARELGASLEDIAESIGITRQGVAYKLNALSERGTRTGEDVVDVSDATTDTEPTGSAR